MWFQPYASLQPCYTLASISHEEHAKAKTVKLKRRNKIINSVRTLMESKTDEREPWTSKTKPMKTRIRV